MKILALTMRQNPDLTHEVRATYSYEPGKEPTPKQIKKALYDFIEGAEYAIPHLVKAGLQREDMREKRATMSFVEKKS